MNDELNSIVWKVGDIVIHYADKKAQHMLMQVVGIDKGLYHTKYLFPKKIVPNCLYRKYGSYENLPKYIWKEYEQIWINEGKYLHDPEKFDIEIPTGVINKSAS